MYAQGFSTLKQVILAQPVLHTTQLIHIRVAISLFTASKLRQLRLNLDQLSGVQPKS